MAVKSKSPDKTTKATARTPASQTTSGIAMDAGFAEGKVFEIEYRLSCWCQSFNAYDGHKSFEEDLGCRAVLITVGKQHLAADGSFDTSKVLQLVRDQVVIPEFIGHEDVNIEIVNISNRSIDTIPTFMMV